MHPTRIACLAVFTLLAVGPAMAHVAPGAELSAAVEALPMPTIARRLEAQRIWRDQVAGFALRLGLPVKVEAGALVARDR